MVIGSHKRYLQAKPFPHLIVDELWDKEFLKNVENECKYQKHWNVYKKDFHTFEKKTCSEKEKMGEYTSKLIEYCNSPRFIKYLAEIVKEKDLKADPYLLGGGIHSVGNQGFLKMHTDFLWHKKLSLYRRLNLLIYLNSNWNEQWGGDLCLATSKNDVVTMKSKIYPIFNRTVLFTTTNLTLHGHPDPMRLPEGIHRKSIALYYYIPRKPEGLGLAMGNATRYYMDFSGKKSS